jgi:hypothetical protein
LKEAKFFNYFGHVEMQGRRPWRLIRRTELEFDMTKDSVPSQGMGRKQDSIDQVFVIPDFEFF